MAAATKPGMQDIMVAAITYSLLYDNGKSDCNRGINMHMGWREICDKMGFYPGRTPASEAYEDGYYSGTFGSMKEKQS
jgi:hypothetical protein